MNYEVRVKDVIRESILELKKSKIDSPVLDSRVLVKFILDFDETELIKNMDSPVSVTSANKIKKLIARRTKHEPIAYITGHKEFFGLDFFVNKNVLIPRPESEWLVEESIKYLVSSIKDAKLNIIDIGTGSGNIIVSIAKTQPSHRFFASDISKKALDVAKRNLKQHNVKIKFYKSDLFESIPKQKFDLIIANLPYVPKNSSKKYVVRSKDDIDYEPMNAIFSKDNGAAIIKKFLVEAKDYLNTNGQILIELDPRNADEIKSCAKENFPNATLHLTKDLADFNRYLVISIDKK